jgi:hypothetical protein
MAIISMYTIPRSTSDWKGALPMRYGIVRRAVAGGLAVVLGVFLTFAQLGGSGRGQTSR